MSHRARTTVSTAPRSTSAFSSSRRMGGEGTRLGPFDARGAIVVLVWTNASPDRGPEVGTDRRRARRADRLRRPARRRPAPGRARAVRQVAREPRHDPPSARRARGARAGRTRRRTRHVRRVRQGRGAAARRCRVSRSRWRAPASRPTRASCARLCCQRPSRSPGSWSSSPARRSCASSGCGWRGAWR
jgi:hypothetical protein